MIDQFDNIIRQAHCIANPEKTVNEIDALKVENEALKEQVKNLTKANGFLFKLLGELTIVSDKVSELNKDLKERNAKLREILVDTLKRN